eukprot:92569-Rhodomonas_salina.1
MLSSAREVVVWYEKALAQRSPHIEMAQYVRLAKLYLFLDKNYEAKEILLKACQHGPSATTWSRPSFLRILSYDPMLCPPSSYAMSAIGLCYVRYLPMAALRYIRYGPVFGLRHYGYYRPTLCSFSSDVRAPPMSDIRLRLTYAISATSLRLPYAFSATSLHLSYHHLRYLPRAMSGADGASGVGRLGLGL